MPAVNTNLRVEQGTTWAHGWLVKYNGDPIDDTWTARGQVRKNVNAPAVLYDLDPTVNDDGSVVIAIDPEVSALWAWRSARYDIEVESPGGVVLRIAEGSIAIDPEVTR